MFFEGNDPFSDLEPLPAYGISGILITPYE
jgi:hypothetical protein